MGSRRSNLLLLFAVLAGAALVITAVFYVYPKAASRRPQFPLEIIVTFLGKSNVDIAGESSSVEPNRKPDAGFRLSIRPVRVGVFALTRVAILSSDRSGRAAGGARWDTYSEGVRAIGVMRDGRVLNPGAKGPLDVRIDVPVTVDLFMEDGGMATFWKYFVLMVEASGGHQYSVTLDSTTWRSVPR